MLAILDVLIGLVFIYGLFSVLVSAATELILTIWSQRGKTLWMAVRGLLPGDAETGKANVVAEFLKHPLVQGMGAAEHDPNARAAGVLDFIGHRWAKLKSVPGVGGLRASFPSYMPTHVFVDTIMHMLRSGSIRHGEQSERAEVADLISDVANPAMRSTLQALHQSSIELGIPFRARLEHWYNDSMDRASGWYKRMAQIVMLLVAFIMAVWCNVDTLRIIAVLSGNSELRKSVADTASEYVSTQMKKVGSMTDLQMKLPATPPPSVPAPAVPAGSGGSVAPATAATAAGVLPAAAVANVDATAALVEAKVEAFNSTLKQIDTLGLPLGWGKAEFMYVLAAWPLATIGWLMSALAATLGANFWFQVLGNLVKLRIAGNKPDPTAPTVPSAATAAPLNGASLSAVGLAVTEPAQMPAPPAGYGLEPEPQDAVVV
jgi:hypothetical protein